MSAKSLDPRIPQGTAVTLTGQGDALLIPGLPLAARVQGAAPAAGLLITVVRRVVLGAVLIPGNGDLEHSGQQLFSYPQRKLTVRTNGILKTELKHQTANT